MSNRNLNWDEILDKYSAYKGRTVDFCKEIGITTQALYRRRKQMQKNNSPTFHAIPLNSIDNSNLEETKKSRSSEVKIEIVKFSISLPFENINSVITTIKDLVKTC